MSAECANPKLHKCNFLTVSHHSVILYGRVTA